MPFFYSTGPVENISTSVSLRSVRALVKVLNNDPTIPAPAVVRAFRINGAKVLLFNTVFNVPPNSATLVVPPLVFPNTTTPVRQWEIQISVGGNQSDVLASVWGLNINGDIIAHHRFAHSELTRIDELT